MNNFEKTLDPFVFIEEQKEGYIRYQNIEGKRWEVHGICDRRLDCMIGAIVDGILIETTEQAKSLPIPELDCPVGPGFKNCCLLEVVEL